MNILYVLFILSVSAVTESLAATFAKYENLVLTCVDVTYPDENNHPKCVEFPARLSLKDVKKYADKDNKDKHVARLIKNVEYFEKEQKFRADIVEVSEAKALLKKPLFCVHGIDTAPEEHLLQCLNNKDKFKKFQPIPVIWPAVTQNLVQQVAQLKAKKRI